MKENPTKSILEQRKAAMKGTSWTRKKAESIFLGLERQPTPFEVWHAAGLYLARHSRGMVASKARELLQPGQRAAQKLKEPPLSTSHRKNRDKNGKIKNGKIISIHAL